MSESLRGHKGATVLLTALAGGQTLRDAARVAGVSERTVARRWADPGFRAEALELRSRLLDRAAGQLAAANTEAVTAMHDLLVADSGSVRLGAARAILELGRKFQEQ